MATPQTAPRKKIDGVSKRVKEESFFVDLENRKKNFYGFWFFVVILLVIIFSTMVYGAVKLRRVKITAQVEDNMREVEPLGDRVSAIKGFGVSTMGFSSAEFLEATGSNKDEFPLKDVRYEISKDSLILRGKLKDSFIPLNLKIKFLAAVKDGKFSFLVVPNSIENIAIYGQPKEKIEKITNESINSVLADNGLTAYGVELSDDRIELKVIKEKN